MIVLAILLQENAQIYTQNARVSVVIRIWGRICYCWGWGRHTRYFVCNTPDSITIEHASKAPKSPSLTTRLEVFSSLPAILNNINLVMPLDHLES